MERVGRGTKERKMCVKNAGGCVLQAGRQGQGIPVVRESESDAQLKPSESTHISGHAKNAALQVAQLCRLVKIS